MKASSLQFIDSERVGGVLLAGCAVLSLVLANAGFADGYAAFWHREVAGHTLQHWISDGLMALFFLLVGLELEREIYVGELGDFRQALLPAAAAIGGMAVPALVHYAFNANTATQPGAGIPMATDIAFALAVLALLGRRVPPSLKVFLTALAVMDDLGAIVVIAVGYSGDISMKYLGAAVAVYGVLIAMNRLRVMVLSPFLAGGLVLWYLLSKSGVHPTLAGVLLAFAVPFSPRNAADPSPSKLLQDRIHLPVALLVLPLFALANTAIVIPEGWMATVMSANSVGIAAGLLVGKPLGIVLGTFAVVAFGQARLPPGMQWPHVAGAGLLGGVGFTMSIFVANLAFPDDAALVDASKVAVMLSSLLAAVLGLAWLHFTTEGRKRKAVATRGS